MVVRVVENADGASDGRTTAELRVRLLDLSQEERLVVGSDLKRQRPVDVRARRLLSSVIAVEIANWPFFVAVIWADAALPPLSRSSVSSRSALPNTTILLR
jgi:hypothetical protein